MFMFGINPMWYYFYYIFLSLSLEETVAAAKFGTRQPTYQILRFSMDYNKYWQLFYSGNGRKLLYPR